MSVLTESHEYTLEQLARLTRIKRQVAAGDLSQTEALEALEALDLPGVQAAGLEATRDELVLERIGGE